MSFAHAIVWTDHQSAQVVQFDAEQSQAQKLKAHHHPTGQHGSAVRAEHEFFAQVCDAIDKVPETLVTGSHTSVADFRHYVDKHRPQTAARVAGYEVVDHLTENQLVALGRKFFVDKERLAPQ